MPEIEQISVNEAVEADIEHKYWFAHGETPLGGSDFIRPLQVCGDMIECETGNFNDKISISVSEYMKKRQHPLEKVGLWDFTPPGPANHLIRLAHRNPDSVGRRLYAAEAARDAAIAQLAAEARLRGEVEAKLDKCLEQARIAISDYHLTRSEYNKLKADRDKYKAVVERLPVLADKSRWDATSPVFRITSVGVSQEATVMYDGSNWIACDAEGYAGVYVCPLSLCYPTREAAEAALQATNAESKLSAHAAEKQGDQQ